MIKHAIFKMAMTIKHTLFYVNVFMKYGKRYKISIGSKSDKTLYNKK
jgi:hypothetical protein